MTYERKLMWQNPDLLYGVTSSRTDLVKLETAGVAGHEFKLEQSTEGMHTFSRNLEANKKF
jgi:hypothetical protein